MNLAFLYTLVSVILMSAVSLLGVFTLSLNADRLKTMVLYLVSFAVGALFGDAFIHLLPEAFEQLGFGIKTSLGVMSGILGFFLLEKFLRWRHCHIVAPEEGHIHPMVTMNLVGDFIHNTIDGMIVGVSYAVSIPIGLTTTLAVLLHEIPQEIGDFGILVHGGLTVRRALFLNLLSSFGALLGALIAFFAGTHAGSMAAMLLPITAGGFIYIAGSDLIPELHHQTELKASVIQFVMITLGIIVMGLLTLLRGG